MSVFSAAIRHQSFYRQINILCFVLGVLLAAAMYTSNKIAHSGLNFDRTGFAYSNASYVARKTDDKVVKDSEEIKKLREANKLLEDSIAKGNDGRELLNTSLQEARAYAGLTEVTGPGVIVTLQDSKKQPMLGVNPESYLIHDRDINEVINELRSAGAEAIAVGSQRVVNSTAVRCVGPVAMVNDVKEGAPFRVMAIGDPETLLSALNITNGVLDGIRRYDPLMAHAEKANSLRLPAFSGNTQRRWSKTVKPAPSNGSKGH
jgi:uncharacterized protein YlxW (UPF0749 family)